MAAAAGSGDAPKAKSPTPAASRKASKADQVRVEVKTVGTMRQPKASKFWVSRSSKFGEVSELARTIACIDGHPFPLQARCCPSWW